ncbi:UNVERIFIED_CONTAM: hypothetical protein GTU68_052801, partial [Idotea baltica]|nr:hypothetical protein [Idotea baltica]
MLRTQHNAWVHTFATLAVTLLGFYVGLSATEWCWIIVAIVSVWTSEALNTAFELLCDVASPEFHPLVENSKDVAAGAVLVSAVGAGLLGAIIFIP